MIIYQLINCDRLVLYIHLGPVVESLIKLILGKLKF